MNDQERQVIDDIFRRLEQVANQPRDPEAERCIAEKVRRQPYAPYALAQAVYVQEQALANLNAELEQSRAEAERGQAGGGFLSSIFGGGPRRHEPPRAGSSWGRSAGQPSQPYGMPQGGMTGGPMTGGPMTGGPATGGPMAGGPWGGMQQRGGGFLQSAMATAAGVAGGVMIANALSHAFGGDHGAGSAGQASSLADLGGDQGGGTAGGSAGITEGLYQDASQDNSADDADYGGDGDDGGDGGDWT